MSGIIGELGVMGFECVFRVLRNFCVFGVFSFLCHKSVVGTVGEGSGSRLFHFEGIFGTSGVDGVAGVFGSNGVDCILNIVVVVVVIVVVMTVVVMVVMVVVVIEQIKWSCAADSQQSQSNKDLHDDGEFRQIQYM